MPRITLVEFAILVALTMVSSRAFADDPELFAKLLGDPAEEQRVINAAARSTVVLQNPCPTTQFRIGNKFVPYKPVSFDNAGAIVGGAWKEFVQAEGCGRTRLLNVLVSVEGPNKLSTIPLLPGTTHASALLQKDAVKYAVMAVAATPGGHEANCQIGYVANTEYLTQEKEVMPGAKEPGWRELWTLASCTQKMLVPMHFIPDSTGTTISAGPNKEVTVVPLSQGGV
jgi:hypothetical protein